MQCTTLEHTELALHPAGKWIVQIRCHVEPPKVVAAVRVRPWDVIAYAQPFVNQVSKSLATVARAMAANPI